MPHTPTTGPTYSQWLLRILHESVVVDEANLYLQMVQSPLLTLDAMPEETNRQRTTLFMTALMIEESLFSWGFQEEIM